MSLKGVPGLLLNSLIAYFRQHTDHFAILITIIKQQTLISLRILDWLVTNYAKTNLCSCAYQQGPSNAMFIIWKEYKAQLKAYSKRSFDPFCRRTRVFIIYDTWEYETVDQNDIDSYISREDGFITTVGQLNFFRWAISNGIINYAMEHVTEIEADMNRTNKQKKNKSTKKSEGMMTTHIVRTELNWN